MTGMRVEISNSKILESLIFQMWKLMNFQMQKDQTYEEIKIIGNKN